MGASLVTGATGFIGSHLVKTLVERGEKIIAVTHDHKLGVNKWLHHQLRKTIKVNGDVRDIHFLKRIMTQYEIDKVYHLAAQSIVKHAWKDPVNTFDINVMGTVVLLEACRQLEIPKILIQSSDKVYGNQMDTTSESELKPTEPYGASKIAMDVAAQSFAQTYGMNIVISRPCNCYGLDYANRIVPNTIRNCLRGESPIIYKNDNSQRQYIFISDLVSALIFLMETKQNGAFNIGTTDIMGQEQVVHEILKHFPHLTSQYVKRERELKEIKNQSMKWDKIRKLGWKSKFSFSEGINLTVKAFRRYGW